MTLQVFERFLKAKKNNGKSYVMLVGVKELAVPFCFLAKQFDFAIDGVLIVNSEQTPQVFFPEDLSGVPLIDLQKNPFPPKLCLVITAVPGQQGQAIWQSLVGMGFTSAFSLANEDIAEMFSILQSENFVLEKIRAALKNVPLKQTLIFDQSSQVSAIRNSLAIAGFPIDGVIQTPQHSMRASLLLVPIENTQNQAVLQMLTQQNIGTILPLYAGELMSAQYYWNAHRIFFDVFDLNNVPDFVGKFEDRLKHIVNAYDGVNISILNVEDETQIEAACALSLIAIDKKILHVVIPFNQAGNQLNFTAAAGHFLLKKFEARLQVLTPESREFWRYFIEKKPTFVSYSQSVRDYYVLRYRNEAFNLDSTAIEFTADERRQFCQKKSAKYNPTVDNMIVSDFLADRWAAMIFGVPIVLVNMPTFTLDDNLIVRAEKTPMLMLPKRFLHVPSNNLVPLLNVLNFEDGISDFNMRMQFLSQNGIKLLDNSAKEIGAAVSEMQTRMNGEFEYTDEEAYMIKTVRRLLDNAKKNRPRDVFDGHVSIDFIKNNQPILGLIYEQRDLMALKNILPSEDIAALKAKKRNKLKIRILNLDYWNTVRTICDACLQDNDIDLKVLVKDEDEKNLLKSRGYPCLVANEYDLKADCPDVFVLNFFNGWLHRTVGDIRKYARLVVATSQPLVLYIPIRNFIEKIEQYWAPYKPDYYLFDSFLYNKLKTVDYFKDKPLLEMGNAKYDGIYNACRNIKAVEGWEKLDGKKVILWTTSHGIYEHKGITAHVSFDIYAKHIFEYMKSHPDLGLIFRPLWGHIHDLVYKFSYWSEDDLNIFREYCTESPNVVFDESDSYDKAFALADAVMTDPNCGIKMSALPLMKPMCIFYRSHDLGDIHDMQAIINIDEDSMKHCYRIYSVDELFKFLDMVGRGEDPMYDIREQAARNFVKHFDGKNGWRIKEFMKQALQNKINSQKGAGQQ